MKKTIAILLLMFMLVMLVLGCVSQQDYDTLMAEYGTLVTRVESAESNLAELQSDFTAEQGKSAKLESDYAAECSKTEKLETDLAAEQGKVAKLESDLTAEQSEVQKLEKDVSAAQSEAQKSKGDYDALNRKMDGAGPYAALFDKYYFVPYFEMTVEDILEMNLMVELLDDEECKEKFTAWMEATTERKSNECAAEFWISVWDGLSRALGWEGTVTQ